MVSFTADRLQKMKELLLSVDWSLTHLTLGLVQTVFGNLMWITKVYTMLKAWFSQPVPDKLDRIITYILVSPYVCIKMQTCETCSNM